MASLEEIRDERKKKLESLTAKGLNPYPVVVKQDYLLDEVKKNFSKLSKRKSPITLAGRVRAIRGHGGSLFLDINDGTEKLQVYVKKDEVGSDDYKLFSENIDIGDFVEVSGTLFLTKKKEKTLTVKKIRIISKSLRSLPDKWHGLRDVEERFRRRYLDILMNDEVKERLLLRSKIIKEIRKYLDEIDFVEVETPMLHPIAGGAIARPFKTHHNALDADLYLRIAPELYLKRLLVAGIPKVYELNRNFRNEGVDVTHNPEFTMLEGYSSYSTPESEMELLEKMFKKLVKSITGKDTLSYSGEKIDFKKPFKTVSFATLLKNHALISESDMENRVEVALKAKQFGIDVSDGEGVEKILDNIYKKKCRPNIISPTFVVDFPASFSPLAKRQEQKPWLVDRFQLVIGGLEMGQGFAELNNPMEQRERFKEQEQKKERGDDEAGGMDEEYVEALEYGMPPATGWGIGIDRVIMLLTDTKNLREVVIFPTLRPK